MKASDAILLGSTLGPQAFYELSDGTGTCALGALCLAHGISLKQLDSLNCDIEYRKVILDKFAWMGNPTICPECGRESPIGRVVTVHLNDTHRWTRERIAAWVATIEPKEESNGELDAGNSIGIGGEENQARDGAIEASESEVIA